MKNRQFYSTEIQTTSRLRSPLVRHKTLLLSRHKWEARLTLNVLVNMYNLTLIVRKHQTNDSIQNSWSSCSFEVSVFPWYPSGDLRRGGTWVQVTYWIGPQYTNKGVSKNPHDVHNLAIVLDQCYFVLIMIM